MDRSVTFAMSEDDMTDAQYFHLHCLFPPLRLFVMLLVFGLIALAWGWDAESERFPWIEAIALIVLLAGFCRWLARPLMRGAARMFARQALRQSKQLGRPLTWSWNERALTLAGENGRWEFPWDDMAASAENEAVFVVYESNRLMRVVPKRAMTPEQEDDFRRTLPAIDPDPPPRWARRRRPS